MGILSILRLFLSDRGRCPAYVRILYIFPTKPCFLGDFKEI